jgi:hypothetical protein
MCIRDSPKPQTPNPKPLSKLLDFIFVEPPQN